MNTPSNIQKLASAGTSVWLDDLSRPRLTSGELASLIDAKGIVGVTTNPAIFAAAMSQGDAYDEQLHQLAAAGVAADEAVFAMAVKDVQDACDVLAGVHEQTGGVDGWVSLEVDPRLAHNAAGTVAQAKELAAQVNRANLMIKIPATTECLPAISEVLAAGISVNVTLIFSVERYEQVMEAFVEGIAAADEAGKDISKIHSVASFFVSRVDSDIDPQLADKGAEAAALQGKAALANARLAYASYLDKLANNPRWQEFVGRGANTQRPLWASTSVKNPEYPDTLYVTELAGPNTVNTMPEATLDATIDHGETTGDQLSGRASESLEVFSALTSAGIDLPEVWQRLEIEGVQKFEQAWNELLATLREQLAKAK